VGEENWGKLEKDSQSKAIKTC